MKLGKVLVYGAAIGALGWRLLKTLARNQQQKAEAADTLNRWEGEGGNIPDVEPPRPRRGSERTGAA